MKHLRLMLVREQKDELLRKLIRLGCVQFREIRETGEDSALTESFSPVNTALTALRGKQASLHNAIELLNRYSPEKTPLLAPKTEVSADILLDDSGIETALGRAEEVIAADDRAKRISAEESRQRGLIEALQPWVSLDLRLEKPFTERTQVLLGTVPLKITAEAVNEALDGEAEECEAFEINIDRSRRYLAVVCLKEQTGAAQEALRTFSFNPVNFSELKGTPKDCINLAKAELNALGARKTECFDVIAAVAEYRKELELAADKLDARIAMAQAEESQLATENVLLMEGWIPAESEAKLEALLSSFDCAWETEEPVEAEYPEVPVKLKNNLFTNGLNMVTNMYSLPQYGTVDPNPLMAPFFILFFGLMMADMGYGLIMIAAAIVAMAKMKPRDNTLSFVQLLLWGGIATFVMGALTGSFFSDIPYQIEHIIHPDSTWQGLPYLFSPVHDSQMVLYGSMVLGLLHLNAGMIVNFVQKKRAGNLADAIWEEGSLWVLLAGGVLAVLKIGNVAGIPVVLIIGIVMLLFGAGRHSKGFGKVTAAFGCIYNTATGWFGDVLSYSRIMALMLAGGVVGQVFNTVAIMPAQNSGINVFSVLAFVVIFLLGHAMNFGLNLLGCYVHDLRLQCLEFFGKFYSDGGKPFTPLKFGGKYVRAREG
jgi:V/A-type H+-transporting ATPase subunit I